MSKFLLELDVSATFSSVAPTLEVWLDGVMISSEMISAQTGSGVRSLSYELNYTGTYPESLQFRFGGDTTGSLITLGSISINGVNVQSKRVNGMGRISKTKYDNDMAMGEAVALRIKDTDVLEAFDTPIPNEPIIASAAWDPEAGPERADLDAITTLGTTGDDNISGYMYNNDVIDGDAGNDTIRGEQGNDQIMGGHGNDIIYGNDGDDVVIGENGDDNIVGGDGADQLYGNAGADKIYGGEGNDILSGNADDDKIYGNNGNDTIYGGTGNDKLYGQEGNDTIYGGDGNDRIYGNEGSNTVYGGDGNDLIFVTTAGDTAYGDAGNDKIRGHDGSDIFYGGDDDDVLAGYGGNDALYGGNGNDKIYGHSGNDTVEGGLGDDFILVHDGADNVDGGDGNDTIFALSGNDTLNGDANDDIINGGDGNDTLDGGADNDTVIGGNGGDVINGGTGNDILHGDGLQNNDANQLILADPTLFYNAATNSIYRYINTATTWDTAQANAEAALLNGMNGHLAVITSQAENDYIQTLLDPGASTWLAGTDDGGGTNWSWNAGSEAGIQFSSGSASINNMYENWQGGEPNGSSTYARMQETTGEWTDEAASSTFGYVIEWDLGEMNDDDAIDTINGGDGNDTIYGYGGNDILSGGDNNDTIFAGDGNDNVNGDAGNDTIDGDAGDDTLNGGSGADSIYGGDGDDTINGDSGNDILYGDNADSTIVMEAGRTAVTQTNSTEWHSVSFSSTIENAVVKMFAEDVTGDPFTLRVRNITDTGFEFQLDEFDYQDGSTGLENISWMAVSSGTHTLSNGKVIQAGFTTATNESITNVTFGTSMSNPVLFSQLSSDNDLSAVVTRNSAASGSGFSVQMQEEEAADGAHTTEDIGWIAIENGGAVSNGMLVGRTGDNVTHSTSTINFGGTFGSTPVFIGDMQGTDGGDTSYAAGVSLSTSQAQVYVDEEESGDTETSHTTENIGYVAMNEGTYTAISATNGSDIIRGGDGDDILYADASVDANVAPASAANPLKQVISADGPDGYWDLSETSGTTADNQGSGGASIDGTINGSPTMGAAALYTGGSTSIDFDGTNDGIRIPDSSLINTGTYAEKTVELVFNADDVTTRQVLYEEGGQTHGFTIYIDGGNVYVTGEHDSQWMDANINASITTGQTYHVAFVFDQPNNSFTGYLDGVRMGSVTVNNQTFPAHSGDIGIGYAPDGVQFHDGDTGGGYYFDGRISDVAIYTKALSGTEVQEHADIVQGIYPTAGAADDTLYGGDGFDQFYGGDGGRDVFVFEAASAYNNIDQINGFDVGEQDAIDISDLLTGFIVGASDINDFVTVTTSGSNSLVAVDANGTVGGASFTTIAQINNFTGTDAGTLYINNSIIVA